MKTEVYKCDIKNCNNHITDINLIRNNIQVIFHSDQTEGRGVEPYLYIKEIDLCESCHKSVLNGNYIHAHGCMGYNEYYFK